ncbi:TspO/MBR family protein [Streptomyces sp. NPDC046977]|uniref:TspO/MBR family protein n=1 Tax=Streptomyces sp. NPDC046977 TaxID=3154703 RepID=UPI0033EE1AB9
MRLISERGGSSRLMPGFGAGLKWRPYVGAAVAVVTAAAAGAVAVDTDSAWYRELPKPQWQPPSWVFPTVWTPLYATIAWSAGRTWNHASERERMNLLTALTVNLTLNAAWSWSFFAARSPRAGLAISLLLDVSNLHVIGTTSRSDRRGTAALLPYAAWCWYATALSAAIVRHDRRL